MLTPRHYLGAALFVAALFTIGHLLLIAQQNAR